MERSKYILILFIFLFFNQQSFAQPFQDRIYNAFIHGRMDDWEVVLNTMEDTNNPTPAFQLAFLNFQYGYIAWCIGTDRTRQARYWMTKMEDLMNALDRRNIEPATILAYRAAFIGFRIGLNRLQAPFIGPKSIEYARLSMEKDANNPMGFLQYANILRYTPMLLGGSRTDAIRYYRLALRKMEQQKTRNWNYLSLLATIATALYENNQRTEAIAYLDKALVVEPNFQWIKAELYPKFTRK